MTSPGSLVSFFKLFSCFLLMNFFFSTVRDLFSCTNDERTPFDVWFEENSHGKGGILHLVRDVLCGGELNRT